MTPPYTELDFIPDREVEDFLVGITGAWIFQESGQYYTMRGRVFLNVPEYIADDYPGHEKLAETDTGYLIEIFDENQLGIYIV